MLRNKYKLAGLSLGGIGADGPAQIHTGTRSGGLGQANSGESAVYEMPDWMDEKQYLCMNNSHNITKPKY